MALISSKIRQFHPRIFIYRFLHGTNVCNATIQQSAFDQKYDVVVVGSGAGGMTAALCAQAHGLSAIVLEKSNKYGGTSAVSGGGIWIPCNDQGNELSTSDSYQEALTYMKILTEGGVEESLIKAYLQNAPEMIRFLDKKFGVKFQVNKTCPDYFPDTPGGKSAYRTIEPVAFDASNLRDVLNQQRESYKNLLFIGRISMTQTESYTLLMRKSGWFWQLFKLLYRYWFNISWRYRTSLDRRMTLGQALVGSLRAAMLKKDIPLLLSTGLESLIEKDNRVVGVNLSHNDRSMQIYARHGVILACGGFESNQNMREQYLPKPTMATWTAAPPINYGDGIRAGIALGADLKFMNLTWGAPTVSMPSTNSQLALFFERGFPGCMIVNQRGERFVNEAAPYSEIIDAIYADHLRTGMTVPCWFIFDATFRAKYSIGPLLPGNIQRDSSLPKNWLNTVYYKADSLKELAKKIGVDFEGLNKSAANMAQFAKLGQDMQFGKGNNVFDRYYSDSNVKPNPCLAPIDTPPFYAMAVHPGDIGTKGGLVTDKCARVLHTNGNPIEGLYAVGNCSASVMGKTYAGGGATLGPAMTFAYIAALSIVSKASINYNSHS